METLISVATSIVFVYVLIMGGALVLWRVGLAKEDISIVDLWWGAGFGIIAIAVLLFVRPDGVYPYLIAAMPIIWAVRFTLFIVHRNVGHGEDPRYTKLRSWATEKIPFPKLALNMVFRKQAHLMIIVSIPLVVAITLGSDPRWPILLWVGALIWLVGVTTEAVADRQLLQFRNNTANKGKILNTGLWRYSRHPNYFGNSLLWWGIYIAACAHPWAILTIPGPILMTHYLINVTGVATLEKKLAKEKPGYSEYMASTSAFIPWPVRNK
jgi:steroid 5-alpha reductase family enzyme